MHRSVGKIMRKILWILIGLLPIFLGSCAFVETSLIRTPKPLKETTISGTGKDKILLMDISGIITERRRTSLTGLTERPSLISRIKEELNKASKDSRIKALILRINSPGGTVTASDIIYHEIKKFKQERQVNVVASLMDIGTSGAFYAALSADKIIAHPTSITGSIGVIVLKFNLESLLDRIGIEDESVKSGDKKDFMSPLRPQTPEEREILQEIINKLHERFLAVIAEERGEADMEEIVKLADGRIFTADQALKLKLIDQIGYLDEAINVAKAEAGITQARVIVYRRPYEYKTDIYSKPAVKPEIFALFSDLLADTMTPKFMYLWVP